MKILSIITRATLVLTLLVLSFSASERAAAQEKRQFEAGHVYVMANEANGNQIIDFLRNQDGSLAETTRVSTGGLGSGPGPLPTAFGGPGPGPLPLNSQDSLIATRDGRFLIAVNAGSNEISVLAITPQGLRLTDKASSGGIFPISVAEDHGLVYVLNAGAPKSFAPSPSRPAPSITGFFLDFAGKLYEIPGSTRVTGAPVSVPADVVFGPDGDMLIIPEVMTNSIDLFPLGKDGRTTQRLNLPSLGPSPFGIAVRDHTLAVAEGHAVGQEGIGVPGQASASTYRITNENGLQSIEREAASTQTAGLWIRFTPNGRFLYTSNLGSGTLSAFQVSERGELSLLEGAAAFTGQGISLPLDIGVTRNGQFLYGNAINSFAGSVVGYRIGEDGSLTPVASVTGFPISIEGVVAF